VEKERLVIENIVRLVDRPKPEKRDIIPFTQNDICALLANLEKTNLYQHPGKRPSSHNLPITTWTSKMRARKYWGKAPKNAASPSRRAPVKPS